MLPGERPPDRGGLDGSDQEARQGQAEQVQIGGVDGGQAEEPAQEDPETHEHHVRLARRAFHVAERLPGPLDVLLASREPQEGAAVDHRARREGDLLSPSHQLQEDDAATVLLGDLLERPLGAPPSG